MNREKGMDQGKGKRGKNSAQRRPGVSSGKIREQPLLERLALRLTPHSCQLVHTGQAVRNIAPSHRNYDVVLALVHASQAEPLGWVLFAAKYLDAPWALQRLNTLLREELAGLPNLEKLAPLVARAWCDNAEFSGRALRRELGLGRQACEEHQQRIEKALNYLNALEENLAYYCKRAL